MSDIKSFTINKSTIDLFIEDIYLHINSTNQYDITVQRINHGRSTQLNRYYRIVISHQIIAIRDMWGDILSPPDMHYINKNTFFAKHIFDINTGEFVKVQGSTTEYDNKAFSEKIEHIRQFFFIHFNYNIPDPE